MWAMMVIGNSRDYLKTIFPIKYYSPSVRIKKIEIDQWGPYVNTNFEF